MARVRRTAKAFKVSTALLLSGVLGIAASACAPPPAKPYAWRCITIVAKSHTDLAGPTNKGYMRRMKSDGATCVTLVIPLRQSSVNSSDVTTGKDTPTDATLIEASRYAFSIGLKPLFSIHNEVDNGTWRGNINPQGTARTAWWNHELPLMVHYGALAQRVGSPMYTLGSEMIGMASDYANGGNGAQWRNKVIPAVKRVYRGLLTYDANWGADNWNTEVSHISFWGALNGPISISAYYPIFTAATWNVIWSRNIEPLAKKWHKQIMFGEAGYWPAPSAGSHPWVWNPGGYNEGTQSALYTWLLQAVAKHQPTIVGMSFWSASDGYTPLNRLAEKVLIKYWK